MTVARVRELMETEQLDQDQAEALAVLEDAHRAVAEKRAEHRRAELARDADSEGVPVSVIARTLKVQRTSVYGWLNA